ncbi:MAG: EF-hand domain-containing protein [Cyanobacteria bacterium]|nr:EF-hand domain-containing protein [Cyanobacteriota bacterium]
MGGFGQGFGGLNSGLNSMFGGGYQDCGPGFGQGWGQGQGVNGHRHHHHRPNPDQILKKVDTNGDGVISKDEFLANNPPTPDGRTLSDDQKGQIFSRLDANGDGSINRDELQNAPPPPGLQGQNGFDGNGFPPPPPMFLLNQLSQLLSQQQGNQGNAYWGG